MIGVETVVLACAAVVCVVLAVSARRSARRSQRAADEGLVRLLAALGDPPPYRLQVVPAELLRAAEAAQRRLDEDRRR